MLRPSHVKVTSLAAARSRRATHYKTISNFPRTPLLLFFFAFHQLAVTHFLLSTFHRDNIKLRTVTHHVRPCFVVQLLAVTTPCFRDCTVLNSSLTSQLRTRTQHVRTSYNTLMHTQVSGI